MTSAPHAACAYCEHPRREPLFQRRDKTSGKPVWACQSHVNLTKSIGKPAQSIAEQPTLFS